MRKGKCFFGIESWGWILKLLVDFEQISHIRENVLNDWLGPFPPPLTVSVATYRWWWNIKWWKSHQPLFYWFYSAHQQFIPPVAFHFNNYGYKCDMERERRRGEKKEGERETWRETKNDKLLYLLFHRHATHIHMGAILSVSWPTRLLNHKSLELLSHYTSTPRGENSGMKGKRKRKVEKR